MMSRHAALLLLLLMLPLFFAAAAIFFFMPLQEIISFQMPCYYAMPC